MDGGGAIFGQPQERQSGWTGWKARNASADNAGRRVRKDGAHRFESPKEARRTGRLEKVPQGAGRNWTGKAARAWSYGSKVEAECGKDQRPAPGPDDGKKSMLRQRWRACNLGVPANFTGGRLRSSDQEHGRGDAQTSEGIPKDSQCFLNPLSETAGGSSFGSTAMRGNARAG